MKEPSIEKVECPSCGQHYSIELTDQDQDVTCQVCQATFIVAKIADDLPATQVPAKAVPAGASPRSGQAQSSRGFHSLSGMKTATSLSILDRFMAVLFRFGKTFASLLAVLCLLSVFGSIAVFALNLRTKMEIPTYDAIAAAANDEDEDAPTSTTALDERRAIEKRFGDRVVAIIKEHKFDQDDYDQFIRMIQTIEPENRSKYLSGLESALKSREAAARNVKDKVLPVQAVASLYTAFFASAESEHEAAKEQAKSIRYAALGAVFVSCFMLFMMLIVPALLRIEENTRKTV